MTRFSCHKGDRGETSIQVVVLVPVMFAIFFLGVHVAALAHGAQVANVAATRGAQVAATSTSDMPSASVTQEVLQVVTELGSKLRMTPAISATADSVRVTVVLHVQSIVPFLPTSVTRSAIVSRERFILEQNR
jgi:hypothetical protein